MGKEPLRLWIVQYLFFPVWAGPALRFFNYSKIFQKQNVDTQFVTVLRPGTSQMDQHEGIPILRLGNPRKEKQEHLNFFLARAVAKMITSKRRPHIALFLLANPLFSPFIRILKYFQVRTIFVSTMATPQDEKRSKLRAFLSDRLQYFYFNSFDVIVCSTERLASDILRLGISQKKIETIPNGVSPLKFKSLNSASEKDNLRARLQVPQEGLIFLFVGLIDPRKGVLDLLAGWREYLKSGGKGTLLLVGQQQRELPRLKNFFIEWDQEFSKTPHCLWKEASPEIQSYYQASDIFIFLSRIEGLPNVIPEAMASSLPIVSTKFIGFSEDFGVPNEHLILTDRDPKTVAEKLRYLEMNAQVRRSLGEKARKFVEENHDVEKSINRYIHLFSATTHSKESALCVES